MIRRVELHTDYIRLTLCLDRLTPTQKASPSSTAKLIITKDIPLQIKRRGHEMRLVIEGKNHPSARADPVMVKAIARSHAWAEVLLTGKADSMRTIATREGVTDSSIKKQMPLAFLAPDIVQAIMEGTQPEHLTTHALMRHINIPLDWNAQRRLLGFTAQG